MTEQLPAKTTVGTGAVTALSPQNLDEYWRVSQALARAGDMVPKNFQGKPEEIMAAIMRGAEIGMAPMQALSNISVINGRACVWGDAIPAVVQRAGHHIDVEVEGEGKDAIATATLTRGDTGKTVVRTFSMRDAEIAGLLGKPGPWKAYPKRMLMHRARAWAVRDGAADALMGMSVIEEMQDIGPERAKDVTPKKSKTEERLMKLAAPQEDDIQIEQIPDAIEEAIRAHQEEQASMFEEKVDD